MIRATFYHIDEKLCINLPNKEIERHNLTLMNYKPMASQLSTLDHHAYDIYMGSFKSL